VRVWSRARLFHGEREQLGQGQVAAADLVGFGCVAVALAVGADDVHIGQELDVQEDLSGAVAGGAAE
jgi:hypothetical protein